MCMISTISCGQDKKYLSVNPIDNENFFYNEFWYFSEGLPAAINFEEYFFAKDGLFTYCRGYSGGMYWKKEGSGTYTYNPTEKIIHLKTLSGISAPEQIAIEKITDTNIVFKGNPILANEDTSLLKLPRKIFHNYNSRVVGVTTDQYWYKGESSSFDCFRFPLFGQAKIKQEHDHIYEYVCEYHIVEDILFLEIKSIKIDNKETKLFTPNIKTFVKVRVKDSTVLVEKIDIDKILDGTRNWIFKDMEFHIDNPYLIGESVKWDEYNRVIRSSNQTN